MAKIIKLVLSKDEEKLYVDCPYNPRFNEDLLSHRVTVQGESPWDPELSMWVCRPECIDTIEEILSYYYPKIQTIYTEE